MSAEARHGARSARVVHVLSITILLAATYAALFGPGEGQDPFFGLVAAVVVGGYSTLGRLIVTRADNVIGWIFLGMAAAAALSLPAEAYLDAAFEEPFRTSLPGTDYVGWYANLGPALIALGIPILFLLFPTGSPPTPRWRWVGWVWLVGASLSVMWLAFRPGEIYGERGRFTIENPFGVTFIGSLDLFFLAVGVLCVLVAAFAAITSLVVRFRRARGQERQQIKWLMLVGFAAAIVFLALGVLGNTGGGDNAVGDLLWVMLVIVLLIGIPVATALAIFRYRLYDVDVVTSKTIVYAGLAVFISLAYVAIVVGVGALLGGGDADTALQIAATATVALAFEPARERLQRFANRLVYGKRATPYEVMSSFGHRMAEVPSIDDVLPDMAETAARGVGGISAKVTLLPGDGGARSVTWPADGTVDDPTFALPVAYAGAPIGEIAVAKPANEPLRPAERTLLEDLAGHAGLALHNVRLASDLETKADELAEQNREIARSRERLVTARDAQRRRLERELRDGIGTELSAIRDEIGSDASRVSDDAEVVQRSLDDLGLRANAALDELRDVARGIFPPLLVDKGLAAALESHVRKTAPGASLEIDSNVGATRLDPAAEFAVYFCCLQALQNAQRHAPGSPVRIHVALDGPDAITFVVADDGPGFDATKVEPGEGTQIMSDRLAALSGSFAVDSAPGRGTTVTGSVPASSMEVIG